jgi:RNA polymerase sigma-70 factor (TIGR02960 family)
MVNADLLDRARNGDEAAFGLLVGGHRRELQAHCYRMLGSIQDAEDALQETLLAAWQSLGGFEGRASIRTWLYRIATRRCLNARRSASHRPQPAPGPDVVPPEPTRLGEVVWLEPYPDLLLDGLPDSAPSPEVRYELRESVSLAFITALQVLPARQRAALVLRDVLGFRAAEAASILDTTEESVTSALKRARATLSRRLPPPGVTEPPPAPNSAAEAEIVDRLTRAWEAADVDGVIALLCDDVWLTMPPMPLEYQGRDLAAAFLTTVAFRQGRTYRFVPTRANGAPAFGVYQRDPHGGDAHAVGLLVVTLAGRQVAALTRFDNAVLPRFGLPRSLPGADSQPPA